MYNKFFDLKTNTDCFYHTMTPSAIPGAFNFPKTLLQGPHREFLFSPKINITLRDHTSEVVSKTRHLGPGLVTCQTNMSRDVKFVDWYPAHFIAQKKVLHNNFCFQSSSIIWGPYTQCTHKLRVTG